MATFNGNAGRVAMNPRGAWDPEEDYSRLDLVTYEGQTYIAKEANTNTEPTDESKWMNLVMGGGSGGDVIDDNTVALDSTWSSSKINQKLTDIVLINVSTSDTSLFGETVTLKLNGTTVASGTFDAEGKVGLFCRELGTYVVECGEYSTQVIVTEQFASYSAVISTSTEITLTVEGAKEDNITILDSNGTTVGTVIIPSGQTSASATLNIKSGGEKLIFASSVSDYAKEVLVDSDTTGVKVMFDGSLYWHGNKIGVESVSTSNGWTYGSYQFSEPTWNTNSVSISANDGKASAVGTTNAVVKGTYTTLHVGIISNTVDRNASSTHSGAIVGALTGKSLPPATWQDNSNTTSSEWANSYHDISAPLGTGDNYCVFWCSPNGRAATAVRIWLE